MTVWELNRRAEGFQNKQERAWQHTASLMASILQPHSKKKVKPKDFMPEAFRHLAPKMKPERIKKDMERKTRIYKLHHGNDS